MDIKNLLEIYIEINLMVTIFIIFFASLIGDVIEEIREHKSIKVKHLFLIPFILLLLPWFLIVTIIYSLMHFVENSSSVLDKDLICFK